MPFKCKNNPHYTFGGHNASLRTTTFEKLSISRLLKIMKYLT